MTHIMKSIYHIKFSCNTMVYDYEATKFITTIRALNGTYNITKNTTLDGENCTFTAVIQLKKDDMLYIKLKFPFIEIIDEPNNK